MFRGMTQPLLRGGCLYAIQLHRRDDHGTGHDLDASRNEVLLPPGERDTGLKMILLEGGANVAG